PPALVVRAFCQAAGESNTDPSALTNQRFELHGRLQRRQLFGGGRSRPVPPRGLGGPGGRPRGRGALGLLGPPPPPAWVVVRAPAGEPSYRPGWAGLGRPRDWPFEEPYCA